MPTKSTPKKSTSTTTPKRSPRKSSTPKAPPPPPCEPVPTDPVEILHRAQVLADPLEADGGMVRVFVGDCIPFLTTDEAEKGIRKYAAQVIQFNKRSGCGEPIFDRVASFHERWLAMRIVAMLPRLTGRVSPPCFALADVRRGIEGELAEIQIDHLRREAERFNTGKEPTPPAQANTKRRAQKGEADTLIAAALLAHHHDENGGAVAYNPVTNRRLAKMAGVATGSVTSFMRNKFKRGGKEGHEVYASMCDHHRGELRSILETFDIPDAGGGGKKAAKKKNYIEETDEQFAHACRAGSVSYGGQGRDDFDDDFPEL